MRFAHLKTHHRFARMRLRGLTGARDEFHLAAIVQNLKTMAPRLTNPAQEATAQTRPHRMPPLESGQLDPPENRAGHSRSTGDGVFQQYRPEAALQRGFRAGLPIARDVG